MLAIKNMKKWDNEKMLIFTMLITFFLVKKSFQIFWICIFLLFYLFISIDKKIYLYYFLLSFQRSLVFNGFSMIPLMQGILLLSIIFEQKFISPNYFLKIILLFIMQTITYFLHGTSFTDISSFLLTLVITRYIYEYSQSSLKFEWFVVLKFFLYGIIYANILSMNEYLNTLSVHRFYGFLSNPNVLGFMNVWGVAVVFILFTENQISTLSSILFLFVLFYSVLLTESRSAIFALIIIVVYSYFFLVIRKLKDEVGILKSIIFSFIFFLFVLLSYKEFIEPIILKRGLMNTSAGNDISSNRFFYMKENLHIFSRDSLIVNLLGYGINNVLKSMRLNGLAQGTHNVFAEALISLGFLGMIIWLSEFIFYLVVAVQESGKNKINRYLLLIVILFYSFTLHSYNNDYYWAALSILSLSNDSSSS